MSFVSPSPTSLAKLEFDPANLNFELDVTEDDFGLRPSGSKADVILALAPAYIELAKLIRASDASGEAFTYGEPFPFPIMKPNEKLIGMRCLPINGVTCVNLQTADIIESIVDAPLLISKIDLPSRTIVDACGERTTERS